MNSMLHSGHQITYDGNMYPLNFSLGQTETPKWVPKDNLFYYISSPPSSTSLKMLFKMGFQIDPPV